MKNKWLYFPILILFLNFIYRLFDQSKMLKYFPVDHHNDGSSYMAQLFFMKVCGFHEICGYWYNGVINFLHSPPGWYFFTLPIFNVFKIVNIAMYVSMLLIFLISFIIIYLLYGKIGFSRIGRLGLFVFFFGNAIAIGNFIKLIRIHELFAWMLFLVFFFLVYYFKDNDLDWRFCLVIPVYGFILLGYQSVGVLASLLFLSLFLVKKGKDRLYVILVSLSSLLITAFWWMPFVMRLSEGSIISMQQATWVWVFNDLHLFTNIFIFIIPIMFGLMFYLYYRNYKKNFLFYSPMLFLGLLFFFRVHPFIPVFSNIFPDPYLVFFIFFTLFLFFKIKFNFKFVMYVPMILIIIALLSVGFNIYRTPFFVEPNSELNVGIENALVNAERSFILVGDFGSNIHSKGIYSYAPTKYNISTPWGWYPEVKPLDYFDDLSNLESVDNCRDFQTNLNIYNVTDVIGRGGDCEILKSCGLKEKVKKNSVCLFYNGDL